MTLDEIFRITVNTKGWNLTLTGTLEGISELELRSRVRKAPMVSPPWLDEAILQLEEYFSGIRRQFALPIDIRDATAFQRRVWTACQEIPYGRVTSYGQLAARIAFSRAARAVGQALAKNPLPLLIPCHRVVGCRGDLTGFSAGMEWKKRLLRLENAEQNLWSWNNDSLAR